MIYKKIKIGIGHIGLVYKNEKLIEVLTNGVYKRLDFLEKIKVKEFDLSHVIVHEVTIKYLYQDNQELLSKFISKVQTTKNEFALIMSENKVIGILKPNSEGYVWKNQNGVEVKRYTVGERCLIDPETANYLYELYKDYKNENLLSIVTFANTNDGQVKLIYQNGVLLAKLEPGVYAFWNYGNTIKTVPITTKFNRVEMTGQEIITKDKVTLRINASMEYKIVDPVGLYENWEDYEAKLYKEMQFAAREAVGALTLEEILEFKDKALNLMTEYLKLKLPVELIQMGAVGIKDIILPGDMKELLNRVVEAQKEAEANNIKRREETAATRSLHNTARMLENNPVLMRLKELESLEKVVSKVGSISIHNGIEGLMKDFVKLK